MLRIAIFLLLLLAPATAQDKAFAPESFIRYDASRPGETWSGTAPIESLELFLDPANVRATKLSLSLRSSSFNSGNIFRDTNARRTVFDSDEYPLISFSSRRVTTEDNQLLDHTETEVMIEGDLTMHGITQPLSLSVMVKRSGSSLNASGRFNTRLSNFGMSRPSLFGILVDDEVKVSFELLEVQFSPP
jgi:polyisoprenoid-binding protein YceI